MTTTSKITFTLNWEGLHGKSTNSLPKSFIRKKRKSSSMTSILSWKFLRQSLEAIANGKTINQILPKTWKIGFSSSPWTKTKRPSSKQKKTLPWPKTLLLFWTRSKKFTNAPEESPEPSKIIFTLLTWKSLIVKRKMNFKFLLDWKTSPLNWRRWVGW